MKLITWNCQGAFRKKATVILKHRPDVVVVQECEHPDKLRFDSKTRKPVNMLWIGDNVHKGLGIFSYSDYELCLIEPHNSKIKFIAPIAVKKGQIEFTLFAIWASNRDDPEGQYVEQIWKAIHHYEHLLTNSWVILTGDFNSNTFWDRKSRIGNHSDVVDRLSEKKIYSIYHQQRNQQQGKEKHPTFYLQKNKEKPYHLDYCFASADLCSRINKLQVGSYTKWIQYSDHVPLIVEIDGI